MRRLMLENHHKLGMVLPDGIDPLRVDGVVAEVQREAATVGIERVQGLPAPLRLPAPEAAFAIGDPTVDRSEYTTTGEMRDWAVDAGLEREREILKIVYGLYSVMQDEKILVLRTPVDEGRRRG